MRTVTLGVELDTIQTVGTQSNEKPHGTPPAEVDKASMIVALCGASLGCLGIRVLKGLVGRYHRPFTSA
jgi:hypothetical protein